LIPHKKLTPEDRQRKAEEHKRLKHLVLDCGFSSLQEATSTAFALLALSRKPFATCTYCKQVILRNNEGILPIAWCKPLDDLWCCLACSERHIAPYGAGIAKRMGVKTETSDVSPRYSTFIQDEQLSKDVETFLFRKRQPDMSKYNSKRDSAQKQWKEIAWKITDVLVKDYGLKGVDIVNDVIQKSGLSRATIINVLMGYRRFSPELRARLVAAYPKLADVIPFIVKDKNLEAYPEPQAEIYRRMEKLIIERVEKDSVGNRRVNSSKL